MQKYLLLTLFLLSAPCWMLLQADDFLDDDEAYDAPDSAEAPEPARHMPLAIRSLLLDVVDNPDRSVVVGERGHVLLSEDRENWRQANHVPVQSTLNAVFFHGRSGWAVGHDETIIHSNDGGENWVIQNFRVDPQDPNPLLDVVFFDARRGMAIGAYGRVMETDDGGATWQESELLPELDWHLNAIARFGQTGLFIAAEAGYAYVSEDLGQSWEEVNLPYTGSMFGVMEFDGGILLFGLRGNAFFTDDLGETWESVDLPGNDSVFAGQAHADGRTMLVGANGVFWLREATGMPFIRHQHGGGNDLTGIIRVRGNELTVIGEEGVTTISIESRTRR